MSGVVVGDGDRADSVGIPDVEIRAVGARTRNDCSAATEPSAFEIGSPNERVSTDAQGRYSFLFGTIIHGTGDGVAEVAVGCLRLVLLPPPGSGYETDTLYRAEEIHLRGPGGRMDSLRVRIVLADKAP